VIPLISKARSIPAMLGRSRVAEYRRREPLVLINGLAEQAESWFANVETWRRNFDVYTPNILAYDAEAIHARIDAGLPIDIDYLVEQLRLFLDSFVQQPTYNLVANSMGGKVALEFTARYPEKVTRLALLTPSGLGENEQLPILEGVRRGNTQAIVDSVFYKETGVSPAIKEYFTDRFANRRWRTGLLRTVQATKKHSVRARLAEVKVPTLLVVGSADRIVDPVESISAAQGLAHVKTVIIKNCGHAPQVERAKFINKLVADFMAS
jgi:pimeloyl-ACP methyl ester carboxylesterase